MRIRPERMRHRPNGGHALGRRPTNDYKTLLRKLAIRDEALIDEILSHDVDEGGASGLDPKTQALVHIAALIGMDAAPASYSLAVESALRSGATIDEAVGTLVAVMPAVGTARVVSAAPKLGLAVGYDVGDALEQRDAEG